jgi:hypothetical protein
VQYAAASTKRSQFLADYINALHQSGAFDAVLDRLWYVHVHADVSERVVWCDGDVESPAHTEMLCRAAG